MDMLIDHNTLKRLANKMGDDHMLFFLNEIFPDKELYAISMSWIEDKKYILKARGIRGDVIIGWIGVHDKNRRERP